MSIEINIEDLFQKWKELNDKVGVSFGSFDFDSIKEIRNKQRDVEDNIYSILLKNAPENIKKILPDECGEFEIGFNTSDNIFYFLTYDPEQEADEEPARIIAITIDKTKIVNKIEDFQAE